MANKEELKAACESTHHHHLSLSDFPPSFTFGVATSAYQVEGASNEGGRGASIWDAFSRVEGRIVDGSNGNVAVDQYHRYQEDIDLLAKLGFDAYRFSISWSRICPDGLGSQINMEGIAYHNKLIDALVKKGIQPYITLYHWDLPLHLHNSMGGWLSKQIVNYFTIYAETCFENFGDRVKNWITINEPIQTAIKGYGSGVFAPGRFECSNTEPYLVAHHQLLAHAAAVSVYRKKYRDQQGGQIGLVVDCEWQRLTQTRPKTEMLQHLCLWYLDPIYHGDYPKTMRDKLGDQLPEFSEEDIELLRNSVDFLGLNHYTTRLIAHASESPGEGDFYKAQQIERIEKWEDGETIGEKAASEWLYVVPWGIRKVINHVVQRYNNPTIYVTENGMDDEDNDTSPLQEMLDDKLRASYYRRYLAEVARAVKNGADVRGYFAWSLLDNFKWEQGYTKRFGLVYVDYKNGLTRHPKSSAYWFSRFLKGEDGKSGKDE